MVKNAMLKRRPRYGSSTATLAISEPGMPHAAMMTSCRYCSACDVFSSPIVPMYSAMNELYSGYAMPMTPQQRQICRSRD